MSLFRGRRELVCKTSETELDEMVLKKPNIFRWHEYTYEVQLRDDTQSVVRAEYLTDKNPFGDVEDHWRFVITSDPTRTSPCVVAVVQKAHLRTIKVVATHRMRYEPK